VALSLRGVARQHGSLIGPFSVRDDLFGRPGDGPPSLRATLTRMARQERSFDVTQCIYGWTNSYEQTWSHIHIRVRLVPDPDVTSVQMATLQSVWEAAIESTWNNQRSCATGKEAACPFTFDVEWVTTDEHQAVRVRVGPAQSNMGTWDTMDTGAVAAHEFGHMFGNFDEYEDAACPSRDPVNTGTIMDDNSATFVDRLFRRLASDIGSMVVSV
jgi:hypothetical protein